MRNKAPGLILFLWKVLQSESWIVTLGKLSDLKRNLNAAI